VKPRLDPLTVAATTATIVSATATGVATDRQWLTLADRLTADRPTDAPAAHLRAVELPSLRAGPCTVNRARTDFGAASPRLACMADLRRRLAGGPAAFTDLAGVLSSSDEQPRENLAAMVAVGSKIHDSAGSPVLSARYHLFARATEGASTCLTSAGPHVSLGRHEVCESCPGAMFEFGACKRCGAVHLTGTVRHGDLFAPQVKHDERRAWLLLGERPDGRRPGR
jgi:hypothetical protein